MLNSNLAKVLTLLTVILPRTALSGTKPADSLNERERNIRVIAELDPNENMDCLSMGELDIGFSTENSGPPNVGVVLTDPRGRRIGFDPLTKVGWQELPQTDGYIHCDELNGEETCRGIVQVCGPVSGTYKLEVIGQQTTNYSVSISARSRETLDGHNVRSRRSGADLNHVAIRAGVRNVVLVNYSRDPESKVSAELQHPPAGPPNGSH